MRNDIYTHKYLYNDYSGGIILIYVYFDVSLYTKINIVTI